MFNSYYCAKYSLIFCLLLSSCASGQQINNSATPTTSPRSTDTLQPQQSPTSTVLEATPTTSITTPEYQKLKDIVFSPCLAISPEYSDRDQIPWVLLILQGIIPYVINPNTGERTDQLLPNPGQDSASPYANDFAVSPNGKWLAYARYSKNDTSFIVEPSSNILTNSSQGRIIWRSSWPSRLERWITNEAVMLVRNHSLENFGSTLIYSPFSREQHEFFVQDLPNYLSYQLGMSGSYLMDHGNLIPDPTLKRVVYPAWPNDDLQLVLWDVENKRALASLRYTLSQLSRDPFWAQDGSDFLIAATKEQSVEWYQVTKDGAIEQLTHFGEFLNDAEFNLPSRSWDGRYLAFQLLYNSRKDSKYLILDLKSQSSLEGFCIDLGGEDSGSLHSPVWSPDNKYVAITNGVYSKNITDVILVDVENREAFHIAHDEYAPIYATGWLSKP
jgi:Tol biopolymer transport system component